MTSMTGSITHKYSEGHCHTLSSSMKSDTAAIGSSEADDGRQRGCAMLTAVRCISM